MTDLRALPPARWPLLLTVAQAAEVLNVSRRTVERILAAGEIANLVRIGGQRRIRREDLAAYIERATLPTRKAVRR